MASRVIFRVTGEIWIVVSLDFEETPPPRVRNGRSSGGCSIDKSSTVWNASGGKMFQRASQHVA